MAKWSGWWEQRRFGRQEMCNLLLEVSPEGEMSGSGDDCVGAFTIKGTIAPEVRLVKRYVGQHTLIYVGTNSGEGIFGTWQVPGVPTIAGWTSGRFALFPTTYPSSDRAAIRELMPARSS